MWLLFIDARAGQQTRAVQAYFRNVFESSGVGLSDDGTHVLMQYVFRRTNIVFSAYLGDRTFVNLNCDVTYRRIEPAGLVRVVNAPTVLSANSCYPQATFAP